MNELRISLFHRFQVCYNATPLPIEGAKAQELLGFLSLYSQTAHTREGLADRLWSDVSARQSRRYLSKTLWQLQTALGSAAAAELGPVLQVDPDWIRLDPGARILIDTALVEEAYRSVQGVAGCDLTPPQVQQLRAASDAYAGDLLEGWYQEWCLYERQRYQYMYLAILDKLIDSCESARRYDAGLDYCGRVLRYDPTRERTHRQMMRLLYQAGDRSAALQQYASCCAVLKTQLDVPPDVQTVDLYACIKAGQGLADLQPGVPAPAPAPAIATLLAEMVELQTTVAALQQRLEQTVHTLRQWTGAQP